MDCIRYGNNFSIDFEERFENTPYSVSIKHFVDDDIVPLHYGKTLEILICSDLKGLLSIDSNEYKLSGNQVFIIPPYTVHSNTIFSCGGIMYVFKVEFNSLLKYVDIDKYLELFDCTTEQFSYECPDYESIYTIINKMIQSNGALNTGIIYTLEIFNVIARYTDKNRYASRSRSNLEISGLRDIITWTQGNYMHKVTLEEVASLTCYSKYYFCVRFKKLTGITYMQYLNSVRISNASLLLLKGLPVHEVSEKCGFESVSYFIKLFKSVYHETPSQYVFDRKRIGTD